MPYLLSHINVIQQHLIPINIIISSQVVRSKKVDAHLRSDLIEKFECAGKFTMYCAETMLPGNIG